MAKLQTGAEAPAYYQAVPPDFAKASSGQAGTVRLAYLNELNRNRRLRRPFYRGEHGPLLDIGEDFGELSRAAPGGASASPPSSFARPSHRLRDALGTGRPPGLDQSSNGHPLERWKVQKYC